MTFDPKEGRMKANMGITDRVLRIIIAAIVAGLYFTGVISGGMGIVLMVIATVFTLTSIASTCPIYSVVGFSARKK